MKTRPHHNNNGLTQIKRGRTQEQVRAIAKRLGIPFRVAVLMDADGTLKRDAERSEGNAWKMN